MGQLAAPESGGRGSGSGRRSRSSGWEVRQGRRRRSDWLSRILSPAVTILVVWAVWEIAYHTKAINLTFFPPPSEFVPYLFREKFSLGLGPDRNHVGVAIVSTFLRVFGGLLIAFVLAFATGVAVCVLPFVDRGILPVVRLLAPIAPIAWIPLALVLFGIGNRSAVALVFMGTYPTLVIATVAAIQQVDPELLKTAATLGASRWQRWVFVTLPAALPAVFVMLRLNFIAAWMSVLAAEMVGLRDGLGALILVGREGADAKLILVGMALIGLSGFLIDSILVFLQRRFLWWETDNRR